ncbi:hypothetical protein [Paludibaculum fermentans]|uniref:Uncharacterized protein n=1 Tax=Paludibaculum fermentans TaxID=1473598 RepID=A0A7S7NTN4_PALFE|nr:hypothetical protein [Paludibaculum fermentans]QOY89615.1 hypothetical protein IRI77_06595 [Paludibaculum fermentans]
MNQRFTPEQIEMLLGGYATGTLTPEENKALMDAALHDQRLFDALMDEEALRETLADGDTRAALLAALRPVEKARAWWRAPWPWAAAATAVVALLVLLVVRKPAPTTELAQAPAQEKVQEIAQNLPKPEPVASSVATPKTLTATPEARSVSDRLEKQDLADKRVGVGTGTMQPATPGNAPQPVRERAERDQAPRGVAGGIPGGAPGGVFGGIIAPPTNPVEPLIVQRSYASAPPPPPPSPQPIRQQEAKKAADEALRATAATESVTISPTVAVPEVSARKGELAKAKAAVEPLQLALAFLQPDGTWHDVAVGAAVPSGRGLRLTVTSERSGMISLTPPLAPPRAIQGGTPLALYLPPREKGEVPLMVSVSDTQAAPSQESASRADRRSNETRSRAKRRVSAMPAPPPPPPPAPAALAAGGQAQGALTATGPLVRSILLKIE